MSRTLSLQRGIAKRHYSMLRKRGEWIIPWELQFSQPERPHEPSRIKRTMIAEMSLLAGKWKLVVGMVSVVALSIADIAVEPKSFEDWTLKGLLLVAVCAVVRQMMVDRKEHKDEMRELRDRHEKVMEGAVKANTESNEKVCKLAEEQALYFKTVTRNIVEDRINGKKDLP